MIDWLTFKARLTHRAHEPESPFWAGQAWEFTPDPTMPGGVAEQPKYYRRKVLQHPSHSETLMVWSSEEPSTEDQPAHTCLWVSGNPSKLFQRHNVFGSDDAYGLSVAMLMFVCEQVDLEPTVADLESWHKGGIRLTRVDVTYSFQFDTLARVQHAITALTNTAHIAQRKRSSYLDETLCFGYGSTRWLLKLYAKGAELNRHPLPQIVREDHPELEAHAQGLLRVELCIRGRELERIGMQFASAWGHNSASELHATYLSRLQIAEASMLDLQTLEGLHPRLRGVYQHWIDGHNCRDLYTRPTFYRHRKQLLAHGIDIAIKQPNRGPDLSNVVPIRAVLIGRAVSTPEWALNTPLYFEPPKRLALA